MEPRAGSLSAVLHPLVLVNISDHITRLQADSFTKNGATCSSVRAVGVLLGTQDGREVEICHSFELAWDAVTSSLDEEFLKARLVQFKSIFPKYDLVGWYATGPEPTEQDCKLHKDVVSTYNESPLMLTLDQARILNSCSPSRAQIGGGSEKIAGLEIYEGHIQWTTGAPVMVLTRVDQEFATGDSERIAVDHMTRVVQNSSTGISQTSAMGSHLTNSSASLKMLADRIDVIASFVDATMKGEIPFNHALLREVKAVCLRITPTEEASGEEDAEWLSAANCESSCISHLSGLTKTMSCLYDLIGKFSSAYDNGPGMGPASNSYDAASGPLARHASGSRGRRWRASLSKTRTSS